MPIRRLDQQARRLERHATGPSLDELIAQERRRSHELVVAASLAGSHRRLKVVMKPLVRPLGGR